MHAEVNAPMLESGALPPQAPCDCCTGVLEPDPEPRHLLWTHRMPFYRQRFRQIFCHALKGRPLPQVDLKYEAPTSMHMINVLPHFIACQVLLTASILNMLSLLICASIQATCSWWQVLAMHPAAVAPGIVLTYAAGSSEMEGLPTANACALDYFAKAAACCNVMSAELMGKSESAVVFQVWISAFKILEH